MRMGHMKSKNPENEKVSFLGVFAQECDLIINHMSLFYATALRVVTFHCLALYLDILRPQMHGTYTKSLEAFLHSLSILLLQ
jgi:hypothetical protein